MITGDLNGKQVMIQILSARPVLATVKNVEPNLSVWIVDDSGDWIDAAHVSNERPSSRRGRLFHAPFV